MTGKINGECINYILLILFNFGIVNPLVAIRILEKADSSDLNDSRKF